MTVLGVPTDTAVSDEPEDVEQSPGVARLAARAFLENKLAVAGLALILVIIAFSWIGPLVYHSDQTAPTLILADGKKATNAGPGAGRPLGMDNEGFDILGRLMLGGRNSLLIGFAAGALCTVLGVTYGAISGFAGKWIDTILMRVVDIIYAFPVIFLFIYISAIEKPSMGLLIVLLGVVTWVIPARLIRSETLGLRTREYVQAMRTMGGGSARAILRHIIPNTAGTIVVTVTFQIADAILILSTLQYFGFGLAPSQPTWGSMLSLAVNNASAPSNGYWWEVLPAGAMIVLTVVSVNFVGDAIQDALEVRLQKR
jgi:peptide/nickel transport system permease protein